MNVYQLNSAQFNTNTCTKVGEVVFILHI